MLGQTFRDGSFTDPCFTNKDWVVFGPPSQHLQTPLYRLIASNNRVQTTCSSLFRQFTTELL